MKPYVFLWYSYIYRYVICIWHVDVCLYICIKLYGLGEKLYGNIRGNLKSLYELKRR